MPLPNHPGNGFLTGATLPFSGLSVSDGSRSFHVSVSFMATVFSVFTVVVSLGRGKSLEGMCLSDIVAISSLFRSLAKS